MGVVEGDLQVGTPTPLRREIQGQQGRARVDDVELDDDPVAATTAAGVEHPRLHSGPQLIRGSGLRGVGPHGDGGEAAFLFPGRVGVTAGGDAGPDRCRCHARRLLGGANPNPERFSCSVVAPHSSKPVRAVTAALADGQALERTFCSTAPRPWCAHSANFAVATPSWDPPARTGPDTRSEPFQDRAGQK